MGDDLDGVTTRISVDGDLPGFERCEDVVAGVEVAPVPDEREGGWMFYSSGTTGQPKGILPAAAGGRPRRGVVPHPDAHRAVRVHEGLPST